MRRVLFTDGQNGVDKAELSKRGGQSRAVGRVIKTRD
jgi:hypothetical protein